MYPNAHIIFGPQGTCCLRRPSKILMDRMSNKCLCCCFRRHLKVWWPIARTMHRSRFRRQ